MKLTNTQRYILGGLYAGGWIAEVSLAMSSWGCRINYKLIGPDGEIKCTVDRRTFKKFLGEGLLTQQGNKWVAVTPPPAEKGDEQPTDMANKPKPTLRGGCDCPEWKEGLAENRFAYNWDTKKWKFCGERTDEGWKLCPYCRRRLTPGEWVE